MESILYKYTIIFILDFNNTDGNYANSVTRYM